jgi:hypothetical protein
MYLKRKSAEKRVHLGFYPLVRRTHREEHLLLYWTLRACAFKLSPPPLDGQTQTVAHSKPTHLQCVHIVNSPLASFNQGKHNEFSVWLLFKKCSTFFLNCLHFKTENYYKHVDHRVTTKTILFKTLTKQDKETNNIL